MSIIFLNHKQRQCGVYQYGIRTARILTRSKAYSFLYREAESPDEFLALRALEPEAIFYNYHPFTMGWLGGTLLKHFLKAKHFCLYHENAEPRHIGFDRYVIVDSTCADAGDRISVPRPLLETVEAKPAGPIPVIGSFGFGFDDKGFERLMSLVSDQFKRAIVRLHIPRAFYGDCDGAISSQTISRCRAAAKPNVALEVTTDFKTDDELLDFLAGNSINAFLYDEMPYRGLSSVIDYALSVKVPIAITKTCMFRHIYGTVPSICVEDRALPLIMASGCEPLQQYRERWSHEKLIEKYESIVRSTP